MPEPGEGLGQAVTPPKAAGGIPKQSRAHRKSETSPTGKTLPGDEGCEGSRLGPPTPFFVSVASKRVSTSITLLE
jgi:hypothetical protein